VKPTGLARLLLWDHGRGSVAYDLLCVLLLALFFLLSPVWLGDPMVRP